MLSRLGTPHLLVCTTLLVGTGLVMVYSASALRAEVSFGSAWIYLARQLAGLGLGLVAAYLLSRVPLTWLGRLAYPAWIGGTLLLLLTLTPLGLEENGARRWLAVGGLTLQPLEPMKLALILALARWLSQNPSRMRDYRISIGVPIALTLIPGAILLLQPDFGGTVMLVLFAATLIYTAGARLTHLLATAALALPLIFQVAFQAGYRAGRLRSFLDPWADPYGQGYQLVQSLLAFGAGGLAGSGLGAGQQKLGYLPEAHTDFILSVVGEEVGLIGVITILICFAVLGLAALGIASRARDPFSLLLAVGASLMLWLQGLLNAGVAMGALPTKGTTLPLFSYGRSSMVTSLAAVGLLLNVARPQRRGRRGWR
ncbi:MAG: putative lipid II flippase FtsW [Myxococcota bacterium]